MRKYSAVTEVKIYEIHEFFKAKKKCLLRFSSAFLGRIGESSKLVLVYVLYFDMTNMLTNIHLCRSAKN